jgi:molybdopterin-guanine dinucleotide biosynthesis protein A
MEAVVLAGERPGGNELARAFGLESSVLVDVAGTPCIVRALDALRGSRSIEGGLLSGPPQEIRDRSEVVQTILENGDFSWRAPAEGPAESALDALGQTRGWPVLLTAADHALLTPEIVDGFCSLARAREADFVVGFVPWEIVHRAFPESKRTVLKFANAALCGSNLYLVRNERGLALLEFWREIQQHRKRPWRIARGIGWKTLLTYLVGRLTIEAALEAVGSRIGVRIAWVELPFPRAAVDVDSVADHALAEALLAADRPC